MRSMTIKNAIPRAAIFATALSVVLSGCVKEQTQEELHEVVFHAGWDAETKTVLQEDGQVFWEPGDEISLFVGDGDNGGYKLTSTNTEPAAKTDFAGQIADGNGSRHYVAIYPFDSYTSYDGSYVNVSIPNWQKIPKGSFDKKAFINIAKSSDDNLLFRNLCGGIKLSVASEGIKEVHIQSGNGGGYIPSLLRVNPDDLTDIESIGMSVEYMVRPAEGNYFDVDEYYYIILPIGSYSSGFTIKYVKDDSYAVYHTPPTEIKNSVFKRLYDKDADLNFKRIYSSKGTISSPWVIPEGVDKSSITEAHFYVNSDVETSTKLLGQSFGDSPIYFELQGSVANYYTSGEIIELQSGSLFKDWTSLHSVDLSSLNVKTANLSYMFSGCIQLRDITWGDFDTEDVLDMSYMFENCSSLQSLGLSKINTSNVKDISGMFSGLTLKSLDLNGFNTSSVEKMDYLFSSCRNLISLDVSDFNTSNVTSMHGMFSGCTTIKTLDLHVFDLSKVTSMGYMFKGCHNLETISFPTSSTANLNRMDSMFEECSSLEYIDLSSFNTSNVDMMMDMFRDCRSLKSLDLSNFNTEKVESFRQMFDNCRNLEHLNISSFNPTYLSEVFYMFINTRKLTTLDLGVLDLHNSNNYGVGHWLGELSKECHIRCTEQTKTALINASSLLSDEKYKWYTDGSPLPNVSFEFEDGLYRSTDYSKDKTVRTIQLAAEGSGIDLVLMGDAYSDRLIADGTYDRDMKRAIDAIFAVEPYKSFKHLFNISIVYAVSENEVIGKSTALDCYDNRPIGSDSRSWHSYYFSAAKNYTPGNISPVILMHSDKMSDGAAAGFVSSSTGDYMNDPLRDDYHGGFSEAVAYILGQDDRFDYIVRHEFGHSFGFLMDEYASDEALVGFDWQFCFAYGLWKNVDLVSDSSVKWAKFINDPRYAGTGIGVYEGACLPTGMWRSSPNSIMNSTDCGFNAPSREAIYYRIHKLAYGKDWPYDYETFVQWDAPNIAADKAYFSARPAQLRTITTKSAKRPHLEMRDVVHPDGRKGKMIIMD